MHVSSNKTRAAFWPGLRGCLLAALIAAAPLAGIAAEAPSRTLVVTDFELIDNTGETAKDAEQKARLAMISQQFRQALTENHLYTVVDNAPAAAMIAELKNRFTLYDCNGCDVDIGKALHADRIMTGWVQKVSNLILNINIQIRDVKNETIILNKSVDIRGNTDQSWTRGIHFMVRSMVEKGQANL